MPPHTQIHKQSSQSGNELPGLTEDLSAMPDLFSDIVENLPDTVLITDMNGKMIYSNRSGEAVFGHSTRDLIGKTMDILSADPGLSRKVVLPSIKRNGKWNGEFMARHSSGSTIPVWMTAFTALGKKGTSPVVIMIIRDLTERMVVEAALLENYQKYSNIFQQSSDAIILYATDGTILDANRKALDCFGYSRQALLSMSFPCLLSEKDSDRFSASLGQIEKDRAIQMEVSLKRSDSTVFPADVSSVLLDIEDKRVVQCIVRDIYDSKKAEWELKKHKEELEGTVKERTLELLEANENLQVEIKVRKHAEKQLLMYQKQLRSLSSQIAMLEEREKRKIASDLHDYIGQTLALAKIKLGILGRSSDSPMSQGLINEILLLVEQAISGTRTLTFELSPPVLYEIGLPQAVQWLVDQFSRKHGLSISFIENARDLPFDNSTRFILFQAVRELLMNIVKHARATDVQITMSADTGVLKMTIRDNGIGFSETAADSPGYGLFNIRERINNINGHFEIRSVPGSGTRATFAVPFKD